MKKNFFSFQTLVKKAYQTCSIVVTLHKINDVTSQTQDCFCFSFIDPSQQNVSVRDQEEEGCNGFF